MESNENQLTIEKIKSNNSEIKPPKPAKTKAKKL